MNDALIPRYRSLDIWRGFACLGVVVYHGANYALLGPSAGTWPFQIVRLLVHGVTIFFVLSGYCITASVLGHQRRSGSWRAYVWRRARRIFPPYWATLAATAAVVLVMSTIGYEGLLTAPLTQGDISAIPHPFTLNIWQWLGNLSLTETWRWQLVWRDGTKFVLGTAWTLCYEEQFYAIAGIVMVLSFGSAQRIFAGCWLVTLGTIAAKAASWGWSGTFLDGRWLLFALGIVAYDAIHRVTPCARTAGYAAMFAAVIAGFRFHNAELVVGGLFATVLVIGHTFDEALMRQRILQPIYACGLMCYSIYLVHWPIAKIIAASSDRLGFNGVGVTLLGTVPLVMLATIIVARLLFVSVERRFLSVTPVRVLDRDRLSRSGIAR